MACFLAVRSKSLVSSRLLTTSISKKELTRRLKDRLYTGQCLGVPTEPFAVPFDRDKYNRTVNRTKVIFANPDQHDVMRDYMERTFYVQAPLPKALGLTDTKETNSYLRQEMDMMLSSGLSQIHVDEETNELAGCCLIASWKTDPDYDCFEVSPVDWLNAAGRLAVEAAAAAPGGMRRADAVAAWRDLHFQLIYHLCQFYARRHGQEWVVYGSSGFTGERFRNRRLSTVWCKIVNELCLEVNAAFCLTGTIPHFEEMLNSQWFGPFVAEDVAPYADLTFDPSGDGGGNVFQGLRDSGGLVFGRALNRSELEKS